MRALGLGHIGRPLLCETRAVLQRTVQEQNISWIEDPSNLDPGIARGFLRTKVLPLLRQRWPALEQTLGRSAQLCQEASNQLMEYAQIDLRACIGETRDRLDLAQLKTFSPSRQRLVIRRWLTTLGLPMPDRSHLTELLRQIEPQRAGAKVLVAWPGTEIRLYRQQLYASRPIRFPAAETCLQWQSPEVALPADCGQLIWRDAQEAIKIEDYPALTVRFQTPGEHLKPAGKPHRRSVKQLFQEAAIPPWLRRQTPYIYAGDQLLGVGDLFWNDAFERLQRKRGLRLEWRRMVDPADGLR